MVRWFAWRRHSQRTRPANEMAAARWDRERNARAYEVTMNDEFRLTAHDELDDIVDSWLTTTDAVEAARLHVRAMELQQVILRLQVRAQKHADHTNRQQEQDVV